jgi:hypothetical protein
MRALRISTLLGLVGGLLGGCSASAHEYGYREAGSLVSVSLSVGGRGTPLLAARDGSGRFYVEAREGQSYEVTLTNRTAERLGVSILVDGLNAINGERQSASTPGRMYVLGPWEDTTVRGWRSSTSEVRRFTFVDERSSYSARSDKANGKMGWIEVAVFREQRRVVSRPYPPHVTYQPYDERPDDAGRVREEGPARRAPESAAPAPKASDRDVEDRLRSLGYVGGNSYPGTGWGQRTYDPVEVVAFSPMPYAADTVTVRYEYAPALRALGLLPPPYWARDRLQERDGGFAAPPRW